VARARPRGLLPEIGAVASGVRIDSPSASPGGAGALAHGWRMVPTFASAETGR
jgi:hypothetical protein